MKINIVSETGPWILPKCAASIQQAGPDEIRWNEDLWTDSDVGFALNYGYLSALPPCRIRGAFYDHYSENVLGPLFISTAREVDFCVAMSQATQCELVGFGIPRDKITVIETGIDAQHYPRLVLGVVGRTYRGDDRKGEALLRAFWQDPWVRDHVVLRIFGEGWGIPACEQPFQLDRLPGFYATLDYLLVPARLEGGPVPFLEALAHGCLTLSPALGYAVTYRHVEYERDSLDSLVAIVKELYRAKVKDVDAITRPVLSHTWERFGRDHVTLFHRIGRTPA